MAGLYFHIPFCASRCSYCGFFSTTNLEMQDRYVSALCREMDLRESYIKDACDINTIYVGGGTPSQLSERNLKRLFGHIADKGMLRANGKDMEITLECNPDDVNERFCQALQALPVNRISMGVQTFSDKRLRFLHRRHTATEVYRAIRLLRGIGIENISIDLMFGFPDETIDEWRNDVEEAISLNVEHISAYSLMYEEGTKLYRQLENGEIKKVNEETERLMYETLIEELSNAGYEHYEISNFARHGYRSRHNSSYWQAIPYMGIGAAAHSYDVTSRQWNVADITKYIKAIEQGNVPFEYERLDANTRYNDLITTALRTKEGISLQDIEPPYRDYLVSNAKKAIANGFLRIDNDQLHLTRDGLFISDDIMSDLIWI